MKKRFIGMNWNLTPGLAGSGAVLALSLASTGVAHAQRDPADRQQQRTDARQRIQDMTPEQRQQYFQQRLNDMTPEQRQQMQQRMAQRQAQMAQARWDFIRQLMTKAGYIEKADQDAVIQFMQTQEAAYKSVLALAQNIGTEVPKQDVTDDTFTQQLVQFRSAYKTAKAKYDADLAALDKQISFSTQPRLEALLTTIGIIGPEVPSLGGAAAVYPNTPMSGRGGGFGGGGFGGGAGGGGARGGGAAPAPGAGQ